MLMTEALVSRVREHFSNCFNKVTWLVILSVVPRLVLADSPPAVNDYRSELFRNLSGRQIEILKPDDAWGAESNLKLPFWAQAFNAEFLKISPVKFNSDFEICLSQFSFSQCQDKLITGPRALLISGLTAVMMRWEVQQIPYANAIRISLSNGSQLKGLLGLKPDAKPRPLVIVRPGIFCAGTEIYGERFLWYMLFEQTDFNILVLESVSSADFILHNSKPESAGYGENQQNIEIIKALRSPQEPLSKRVSEIHLVGMSLGGPGVLLTAKSDVAKTIASVTTMCPLIDLPGTIKKQSENRLAKWVSNNWAGSRLSAVMDRIDRKTDFLVQDFFAFLNSNNPNWQWQDFLGPYKTPVTVIQTQDDPLVDSAINFSRLQPTPMEGKNQNAKWLKQQAYHQDPKPDLHLLPEGIHCSFWVPYDWKWASEFLTEKILKRSDPQLWNQQIQKWPLTNPGQQNGDFVKLALDPAVEKVFYLADVQFGANFEEPLDAKVEEQTDAKFESVEILLKVAVVSSHEFNQSWFAKWLTPHHWQIFKIDSAKFGFSRQYLQFQKSRDQARLYLRQNLKFSVSDNQLVAQWKMIE
jgi:hypothetical protein